MRYAGLLASFLLIACATSHPPRVQTRMVLDEANAVLAILDKRAAGGTIDDADWRRLFASEGYVRLKKRELSMQRSFEDETFRAFVMSNELLVKREMLQRVVVDWSRANTNAAAQRALAYLPKTTAIRATVYPVIKPATNSFVFEVDTNPAIFMYVEDIPRTRFENTIAHELHHVGYGTACSRETANDAQLWAGAFGEGFAVLAAAGGVDQPPQAHAAPEVQEAWAKGIAELEADFRRVETFLLADMTAEERRKQAMSFFGMVGPWYTIGWHMAVTIERVLRREALVRAMCEQNVPATYNRVAGPDQPRWSQELLDKLMKPSS